MRLTHARKRRKGQSETQAYALQAESLQALGAPDVYRLPFLEPRSQTPGANQNSQIALRKGPRLWFSCFTLQYRSLTPNAQHVAMLSHDTALARTF